MEPFFSGTTTVITKAGSVVLIKKKKKRGKKECNLICLAAVVQTMSSELYLKALESERLRTAFPGLHH